ncbi:MAG: trypsin-like peptidase domain-containing protein, partial [Elusimicrobiota bacterium]
MVARVKPAVVNVIVHQGKGYAIGSGFILTPEGVFITNGHVVGDKQPVDIINAKVPGVNGELKAKVLAINHDKDLAIVQLPPRPDGKPWPAQTAPREGEEVTAIGYPRGLPFTVSKGVVSGLDGRASMYVRKLQTDAAINPGNSGGPLFNDRGEVIGVNTEIHTQSGGSEGLGFSIQAPEVRHIMEQFARTGNIAAASLGIIANLSDPMAPEAGLEIEYVRHGSAAEKAGLLRGDLLIGIGEQTIEEGGQEAASHVAAILSKMIPGQTVTIVVLRGDSPVELTLTVDAKATRAPSH